MLPRCLPLCPLLFRSSFTLLLYNYFEGQHRLQRRDRLENRIYRAGNTHLCYEKCLTRLVSATTTDHLNVGCDEHLQATMLVTNDAPKGLFREMITAITEPAEQPHQPCEHRHRYGMVQPRPVTGTHRDAAPRPIDPHLGMLGW